jgi:acyl carrier protein
MVAPLIPDETLHRVRDVLRDVLDDDALEVSPRTVASDVDGWDSLNHVRIMISIEKAFGIRFSAAESKKLANVGELVKLIDTKKTGAAG